VTSGGSFGASPLAQHVGLGRSARIETLEVFWPTGNTRQVFHDVPVNQTIELREGDSRYTSAKRPPRAHR
jgi:ASPIC and UnbV